jgi:hypothetical protein
MRPITIAIAGITLLTTPLAAALAQHHGSPGAHGEPGPHAHRAMAPPPRAVSVPDTGLTLPLEDIGGRPVVRVTLNGKGPFPFILDTGASITVVDSALQAELTLPAAAGVRAAPASGRAAPVVVTIETLGVGGAKLEGVTAAAMPLGRMFQGANAPRGVLNASSFPGHLLTFDYPRRSITLRRGALDAADERTVFAYPPDDALPTVPLRIGAFATRVHLDTGSGFGLMLPNRHVPNVPLDGAPKPTGGRARTHSGESPIQAAPATAAIRIGELTLGVKEVWFSDVRAGSAEPIGNVGYEVLKDYVVTLDATNRRIRLAR